MDFTSITQGIGSVASDASLIGGALHAINDIGGSDLFGYNKAADKRQLEQQTKLQNLQITGEKQMWDYTNYENQMKHLESAGLNPGLLYAKGGSGGTTGSITGGQAANSAQTKQADLQSVGMGLSMAAMQSQIAVQQAQARDLNASANLKENYQGDNIKAGTSLLLQQAKTEQEKQIALEIQNEINNATKQTSIDTSIATLRSVYARINNMEQNTEFQKAATEQARAAADELGKRALVDLSIIRKNDAEIAQGWERLKVAWAELSIQERAQLIQQYGIDMSYVNTLNQVNATTRGQDISKQNTEKIVSATERGQNIFGFIDAVKTIGGIKAQNDQNNQQAIGNVIKAVALAVP